MSSSNRHQLLGLSLGAFGGGGVVTAFCAFKIYETAQLPAGDGTGMQWIILTPLTLLFVFVALPAFIIAARGLRRWSGTHDAGPAGVLPGRGWLLALGLLLLYLLAPFVVAPMLGVFASDW